jgi:hypothetical protein
MAALLEAECCRIAQNEQIRNSDKDMKRYAFKMGKTKHI